MDVGSVYFPVVIISGLISPLLNHLHQQGIGQDAIISNELLIITVK